MTIRAALRGLIIASLRAVTAILLLAETCILLIVAAAGPLIARLRAAPHTQASRLVVVPAPKKPVLTGEAVLTGRIPAGEHTVAPDKLSRLVVGLVGLGFKTPAVNRFVAGLEAEHVAAVPLANLLREGLQALSSTN